jgi:hypothetical protein
MKRISELLSNLPLLTGLLICLSLLKYIIFYDFFSIPITQYFQISEILLLFTDDLIYIFVLLVAPRLIGHFEAWVVEEKESTTILPPDEQQHSWNDYVKEFKKKRNTLLIMLSLGLLVVIVLAITGNRFQRTGAFYSSVCILLIIGSGVWEKSLLEQNIRYQLRQYLYYSMLFLFVVLIVIYRAVDQASSVDEGKFIGTTIRTKDSTYVSDSAHIYIGRTKEYTYIYNKPDKSSTILPNSEIERVVFKSSYGKK